MDGFQRMGLVQKSPIRVVSQCDYTKSTEQTESFGLGETEDEDEALCCELEGLCK